MRANRSFVWGEAPLRILRKGALFFCFGRGLTNCCRAGLRRTTIFSVQKEQKNAILLLLFNILCRKTFVLAFLSKTLDYSQRLCYNSIRDFVSWFVMQKNRKATKNPSRCIRTERFWRNWCQGGRRSVSAQHFCDRAEGKLKGKQSESNRELFEHANEDITSQ